MLMKRVSSFEKLHLSATRDLADNNHGDGKLSGF